MTNRATPFYNNAVVETGASLARHDGSLAEATVYDKLREQLDPDWAVAWGKNLGAHEYDFLVLVPGRGIVNLECKGKGYRMVSPPNKFVYENHDTGKLETKDPVGQATRAAKYYNGYLQTVLFGEGFHWGLMGFAVVFPFEPFKGVNLVGTPVHGQGDCDNLKNVILQALDAAEAKLHELGVPNPALLSKANAERVWDLWNSVGDPITCVKPDLSAYTRQLEQLLTVGQSSIKEGILSGGARYSTVEGAAGTGKTILAQALCGAQAPGAKSLYVCFNRVLAQYINMRLPENSGTTVAQFHLLDKVLLPTPITIVPEAGEDESVYWSRVDFAFLEASRQLKPGQCQKFDMIVIDEAQDLNVNQIRFLQRFITANGKLVLLADSEQILYPNRLTKAQLEGELQGLTSYKLSINVRNPRTVVEYCQSLIPNLENGVVDGPPVIYAHVSAAAVNDYVKQQVLARFNPRDIAVLAPWLEMLKFVDYGSGMAVRGPDKKASRTEANLLAWRKNECAWKSTINQFKGLEAMAVVLLIPSGLTEGEKLRYVGASRATYQLYCVELETC